MLFFLCIRMFHVKTDGDRHQILTIYSTGRDHFVVKRCTGTNRDVLVFQMVVYHGKCGACGVGKNHKNFKGCRKGRLIPDPCYVALWKRRPAKDDRLCTKYYKDRLSNVPSLPMTPATVTVTIWRSPISSLDGVNVSYTVHWLFPYGMKNMGCVLLVIWWTSLGLFFSKQIGCDSW